MIAHKEPGFINPETPFRIVCCSVVLFLLFATLYVISENETSIGATFWNILKDDGTVDAREGEFGSWDGFERDGNESFVALPTSIRVVDCGR
jgi:hypothetical protein